MLNLKLWHIEEVFIPTSHNVADRPMFPSFGIFFEQDVQKAKEYPQSRQVEGLASLYQASATEDKSSEHGLSRFCKPIPFRATDQQKKDSEVEVL